MASVGFRFPREKGVGNAILKYLKIQNHTICPDFTNFEELSPVQIGGKRPKKPPQSLKFPQINADL